MIILVGKTASGKTSVAELLKEKGYHTIRTYTTRPRRNTETEDAYHFISEKEFLKKAKSGFFAEWTFYDTVSGKWYYGSAKEDYLNADDKTIIILNPYGLKMVREAGLPAIAVYLYADEGTLRSRLESRGDDPDEVIRRIAADDKDFKDIDGYVDAVIVNGGGGDLACVALQVDLFVKFKNAGKTGYKKIGGYIPPERPGASPKITREYYRQGMVFKDTEAFYCRPDEPCYAAELSDTVYTGKQIIEICGGQAEVAARLFDSLDWQHPETQLEDWISSGEIQTCGTCGKMFLSYDTKDCPHCGTPNPGYDPDLDQEEETFRSI